MSHDYIPPISEDELSDEEVLIEIEKLKKDLSSQMVVLGHHYQQDDIVRFADIIGDSLILSQKASQVDKPYVVFCGVHFMAETADILGKSGQKVILPDLNAGCSMADMATAHDVKLAFDFFEASTKAPIMPVTYVNSSAAIKAEVGKRGGFTCTSSNAEKMISKALKDNKKLFFLPDQHLGRNTCYKLGISLDDMVLYDPRKKNGGLKASDIEKAKVILWYGYCSVHQGFKLSHIEHYRKTNPKMKILVHSECEFDVVQHADGAGSSTFIIDTIKAAPPGSEFAVGTEINLVNRLAQEHPDKMIKSLSPYQCLCTTMYRIRPRWLLETFRSIKRGEPINVIKVPEDIKVHAKLAIERMLTP